MNFIDTHAHTYLPEFEMDLEPTVKRAKEAGIVKIILPNIDSATLDPMNRVCDQFNDFFYPLIGLHPTHVKENFANELKLIFESFKNRPYYGIGEIGIDLYWDKTFFEQQKFAFGEQVKFALLHELPVVIHARESLQEILNVLKDINAPAYKGIFHAFPGNSPEADQLIEMGFYIGIGGVVTYKNSHLPEVLSHIDLNHVVLETDSPYLAPVPYRGKRNESSYIPVIAEKIAQLKNITTNEVAQVTTRNALKLFGL